MTPMMFEYSLFQKARADKKRIVLPEATDERVLRACEVLLRRDAVEIILLGKAKEINQIANTKGLDITRASIVDPESSELIDPFVETFCELRRSKGVTRDGAIDMVMSPSYFGTMMVHMGYADGMVSGAIHTTQETIRPALQVIKTRPGTPIVSSLFFMSMAQQVLIYADCAINQDPDPDALATIAITTADTAAQFGFEPRVAMLSYSTGGSGKGADVDKVTEATRIARERRPDLLIEGADAVRCRDRSGGGTHQAA
jgi:phosphate acetyltransferase